MNTFQWIAIPILGLLFLRAVFRLAAGARPRWWLLVSAAIWLAAAITILIPDLTTDIAHTLGIGRGADLLIYIVAILFIASFFFFYNRYRRLEAELTRLVRQLALEKAETENRDPPAD
ncbi:MAG: DUF2304 domain-containing protein [Gemmatimonadota bacterium]|jgi:hypothetical protein